MIMTNPQGAPMFHPLVRGMIARGNLRMIILTILQDRPMHGYEIARVIGEKSRGFYKPSAGSVYPVLRSLLESGCIKSQIEGRRKRYQITPKGRRLVEGRRAEIERCMMAFKESLGQERAMLMDELGKTGRFIAFAIREITPEQARELAAIITDAREKMLRIISK